MATVIFGDFEWNSEKAETNREKHGVTFEEATTVFLDLNYELVGDPTNPERVIALGYSSLARMLFVVHCERGERVRIISARKASRTERNNYETRRSP